MSSRSFESLASSRDSSEDCLKVCSGEVLTAALLTAQQNYDIVKQLGDGVPPVVYLATCKRGRLKRRTVALKKVLYEAEPLVMLAPTLSVPGPYS